MRGKDDYELRKRKEIVADDALLLVATYCDIGIAAVWDKKCIPQLGGISGLSDCYDIHDENKQK